MKRSDQPRPAGRALSCKRLLYGMALRTRAKSMSAARTTDAPGKVMPRSNVPRPVCRATRGWRHEQSRATEASGNDSVLDSRGTEELLRRTLAVEAEVPGLIGHQLHSECDDCRQAKLKIAVAPGASFDEICESDPNGEELFCLIRTEFCGSEANLEKRAPEAIPRPSVVASQLCGATARAGSAYHEIKIAI